MVWKGLWELSRSSSARGVQVEVAAVEVIKVERWSQQS